MFSHNRQMVLKKHLRLKHTGSHKVKWWLKNKSLITLTGILFERISDTTDGTNMPGIETLKRTHKKGIFRVQHPEDADTSFIVKVFWLKHFSHRLSYHLYAMDEAANLITAANKGIKTPDVFGYGNIHDCFGFVKASIIIMEDLRNFSTIKELLQKCPENEHNGLFNKTIPLFLSLYRSNCHHIDINWGSVMLSEDESNANIFLLDFQHALFHSKPNISILMFETGYFARACRDRISDQTAKEWVGKILDSVGVTDYNEQQDAKKKFEYHLYGKGRSATQTTLSRKQRKKIR